MQRKNPRTLADRVVEAAEAALARQDFVSAVDVLVGVGWLDGGAVKRWRLGQIEFLKEAIQANLSRVSEAMKLFRSWARAKDLSASERSTSARAAPPDATLQPQRRSRDRTGLPHHWGSRALSEKKRERLAEKANAEPELVAILRRKPGLP